MTTAAAQRRAEYSSATRSPAAANRSLPRPRSRRRPHHGPAAARLAHSQRVPRRPQHPLVRPHPVGPAEHAGVPPLSTGHVKRVQQRRRLPGTAPPRGCRRHGVGRVLVVAEAVRHLRWGRRLSGGRNERWHGTTTRRGRPHQGATSRSHAQTRADALHRGAASQGDHGDACGDDGRVRVQGQGCSPKSPHLRREGRGRWRRRRSARRRGQGPPPAAAAGRVAQGRRAPTEPPAEATRLGMHP